MFKKIISKRGYIFTYEAIIIAFIFLSIFYIGYMVYSHNMLTALEEKKDTEKFHKALLLKDFYLKKYEFPGNYNSSYIENFTKELNIEEKTFDPINNFSEVNGSFYYIIYPNIYDEMLDNISGEYNNFSLKKITLEYNDSGKIIDYYIYSNVYKNYNIPSSFTNDVVCFKENLYIPKITGVSHGTSLYLYGCNGDHIYFKVDKPVVSASAKIIIKNKNPFINWENWKYASPILIVNSLDTPLQDYDVKVVFDSQTYIKEGEMRNDCGDVRFVDENGNPLSYWIEPNTINTTHTVAWVRVNLGPNEHKIIYMLYGNPNAESAADGENTFPLFFDDFSEGNLNKWNHNFNNPLFINDTYENGINYTYLSLDYNYYNPENPNEYEFYIATKSQYPTNYSVRFRANFHKRYEEWGGFYYGDNNKFNREIISNYHWGGEWLRVESSIWDQDHISYIVLQNPDLYGNWHTYEIQRNGGSSVNFIIDDKIYKTIYSNIYTLGCNVSFYAREYDSTTKYGYYPVPESEQNGNISIDWVFVRPYYEPEPNVTLLSSNVVFSVNGYVYEKPLTSILKPIDITPNLKTGINEIRILSSPLPVEFLIETAEESNFYYVTLAPENVTIMVKP
ncbi:Protein of unknown function DUF2341 [Methanocaldococcus sp. FS406-22]|uniref:DUF2341 domain-containing protein n=1 Tax=Methanocaldococcus sp. (strain FS406-22) TaxID=644281 RepID=UPI0001BF4BC7|nr:DUF2341 domain-containing protein [Methanocaldococcus sp. FS406-22]ADC69649.1 Protein of unknown function DUF2341 [Methanocaldococcus sp. FS406-22]